MNKATNIVQQHRRASVGYGFQLSASELDYFNALGLTAIFPIRGKQPHCHRSLGYTPLAVVRRLDAGYRQPTNGDGVPSQPRRLTYTQWRRQVKAMSDWVHCHE